jgi:hypothetical protein
VLAIWHNSLASFPLATVKSHFDLALTGMNFKLIAKIIFSPHGVGKQLPRRKEFNVTSLAHRHACRMVSVFENDETGLSHGEGIVPRLGGMKMSNNEHLRDV